jgi:hypothetical protein
MEDRDVEALGGELTGGESRTHKEKERRSQLKLPRALATGESKRMPRKKLRILGFFVKTWGK